MKYHSPFSVIVISLAVLLVFAAVALAAVFSIGMTSPTLMAAEKIMEELRNSETPVSLSFDSIDRNLRDGVFIHGFKVGYEGKEVLTLERVTLHMGLLDILRFAVFGSGSLEIEGEGGVLSVPPVILPEGSGSGEESGGGGFSLPSVLDKYSLSFHLHGISMNIMDTLTSDDLELSLYLDHGIGGFSAMLRIPSLSFAKDGTEAEAESLLLSSKYDDGFSVSASLDTLSITRNTLKAEIKSPVVRAEGIDAGRMPSGALSFSSADISYGDISFSLEDSSATYDGENGTMAFTFLSAESGGYTLGSHEIDILCDERKASAEITGFSLSDGEKRLAYIPSAHLIFDADDRKLSLTAGEAFSIAPELFGGDATFSLSGISLTHEGGNPGRASLSGSLTLLSPSSMIDGSSASFRASASGNTEGIDEASLVIDALSVPGMEENAEISFSYGEGGITVSGNYGESLSFSGEAGDRIALDISANALPLSHFLPIIDEFVPVLYNYIGDTTTATGSVMIDLEKGENGRYTGPSSFAMALSDIMFTGRSFSAAAAYSGYADEDELRVSSASLTTDFIRASYTGSIIYSARLPEGRFALSMTDSGYEFFIAELNLENDAEYSFSARIPYFSRSWLRGSVNWSDDDSIVSSATLRSGDTLYPFDITIDFTDYTLLVENPMLRITGSLGEILRGRISFTRFALPLPANQSVPCRITADVNLSFDFSEQQFRITSDDFIVEHIWPLPGTPDLSFSVSGDNDTLTLSDILIAGVGMEPLSGMLSISYRTPSAALSMETERSGEHLMLSIVRSDDGIFSGLLKADSFDLSRIGIDGLISNANLTARAADLDALLFSGTIEAHGEDEINDPRKITATLSFSSRSLRLTDVSYSTGLLSISSPEIYYSAPSGRIDADYLMEYTMEKPDRDYIISSAFSVNASIPEKETIYALAGDIFSGMDFSGSEVSLEMEYLDLGNGIRVPERSTTAIYNEGKLSFTGSLLSGVIESGSFSLAADLDPVAVFTAERLPEGEHDMELRFAIEKFEISIADFFIPPTIVFYSPAPAHGEVIAVKDGMEWNLFGSLGAEEVAFDVFWMPGERVILHNPYFVIWDNSIDSVIDDCTVLDLETYERSPGRVGLSLDLSSSLSLVRWEVDVYADKGNEVGIRLPMASSGMDLWGDVTGELRVSQESENVIFLGGDLDASNLTMSIGVGELPFWYQPKKRADADLSIHLENNVKFIFPLVGDPILRADVAENQDLRVVKDSSGLSVSGSLDLRSGEIFYFQKNFYITEGNISFRQDPLDTGFNPIINLRARLRDFDSDGNPVDIYLVLRDSTLDNLSPTLESSPSKPIEEIMQILGQAILPSDVYGDITFSSMVSLVSASVDILSRLGIISDSEEVTLEQSIRSSLSLDTFSLHTNIIENLLLDTLSYASSNLSDDALSPMAKYLNGTTLYLGKYLSPELYLEGMVHLAANPDQTDERRSSSFLADDLDLDIELSLEWANPLAVFTFFTQPENFTIYDLFNGLGFGISKRIVW